MNANFERAKGSRRPIDRRLMNGEWPVLLNVMGKGEGEERYLSVAEVSALFAERRLPDRIVARLAALPAPAPRSLVRMAGKFALWTIALAALLFVAIVEFPDRAGSILPQFISQILPPPLPTVPPVNEAHWLDQNWSTEDRHWFHHASQGTATFPVPYDWFIALEQPGLRLFSRPGLLRDSGYLERFGFIPSPKSVNTDEASLRPLWLFALAGCQDRAGTRLGRGPGTDAGGEFRRPAGRFCATDRRDRSRNRRARSRPDRAELRGLSRRQHSLQGRQPALRRRPGDGESEKAGNRDRPVHCLYAESTGPFPTVCGTSARRGREQARIATSSNRGCATVGQFLLDQKNLYDKTIAGKKTYDGKQQQADTEEGFGRLDALNRIGNQVFSTDLVTAGLSGFEKNLHAQDAPVSFPPIWTVPWFLWAQYDASIEQPLIRNAGEALGVSALVNFSPDMPRRRFSGPPSRSKISFASKQCCAVPIQPAIIRLSADCSRRNGRRKFSQSDPAWKINEARVSKKAAPSTPKSAPSAISDRSTTPRSTSNIPDQSFWSSEHWDAKNKWLDPVQKGVAGMGTDKASGRRSVHAKGGSSGLPEPAAQAGPVAMPRYAAVLDGNAVPDRLDDGGRRRQPKMDERAPDDRGEPEASLGDKKKLSQ